MRSILLLVLTSLIAVNSFATENKPSQKNDSVQPSISVPTDDPNDPAYLVLPGTGFDGVVGIAIGNVRIGNGVIFRDESGTGTLLRTGRHILTAAHLWNDEDRPIDLSRTLIFFNLPSGPQLSFPASITIHPEFDLEDRFSNNDIAIIELPEEAPAEAEQYELYRGNDEVGQVFTLVGYGKSGTGLEGEGEPELLPRLRKGQNRFEVLGDVFNEVFGHSRIPGSQLFYDFDNGNPANDASGIHFGIFDLGLGELEVMISSGDSGGPNFIDNKIAGISSGRRRINTTDVDEEINSSFGEFGLTTRVSFYADWIDSVIGTSATSSINGFELYK